MTKGGGKSGGAGPAWLNKVPVLEIDPTTIGLGLEYKEFPVPVDEAPILTRAVFLSKGKRILADFTFPKGVPLTLTQPLDPRLAPLSQFLEKRSPNPFAGYGATFFVAAMRMPHLRVYDVSMVSRTLLVELPPPLPAGTPEDAVSVAYRSFSAVVVLRFYWEEAARHPFWVPGIDAKSRPKGKAPKVATQDKKLLLAFEQALFDMGRTGSYKAILNKLSVSQRASFPTWVRGVKDLTRAFAPGKWLLKDESMPGDPVLALPAGAARPTESTSSASTASDTGSKDTTKTATTTATPATPAAATATTAATPAPAAAAAGPAGKNATTFGPLDSSGLPTATSMLDSGLQFGTLPNPKATGASVFLAPTTPDSEVITLIDRWLPPYPKSVTFAGIAGRLTAKQRAKLPRGRPNILGYFASHADRWIMVVTPNEFRVSFVEGVSSSTATNGGKDIATMAQKLKSGASSTPTTTTAAATSTSANAAAAPSSAPANGHSGSKEPKTPAAAAEEANVRGYKYMPFVFLETMEMVQAVNTSFHAFPTGTYFVTAAYGPDHEAASLAAIGSPVLTRSLLLNLLNTPNTTQTMSALVGTSRVAITVDPVRTAETFGAAASRLVDLQILAVVTGALSTSPRATAETLLSALGVTNDTPSGIWARTVSPPVDKELIKTRPLPHALALWASTDVATLMKAAEVALAPVGPTGIEQALENARQLTQKMLLYPPSPGDPVWMPTK